MAKLRYIKDSFWTDPYISRLLIDEKLCFLYLLTNQQNNIAGVYEFTVKRVSYDTEIKQERVLEILNKLQEDGKIIIWKDWVWLVNFAKNQASNPAVEKGVLRVYSELPDELQIIIRGETVDDSGLFVAKRNSNITTFKKNVVKKRDNFKCVLCGDKTLNDLQVDHIVPIFLGGTNEEENLRTLCKKCNLSRNGKDYDVNSYPVRACQSLSEDNESPVGLSKVKLSKIKLERETISGLPEWLDKEAWNMWLGYQKEKGKALKPTTISFQLKKLEKYQSIHKEVIYHSIEKNWTGLFPESFKDENKKPSNVLKTSESSDIIKALEKKALQNK